MKENITRQDSKLFYYDNYMIEPTNFFINSIRLLKQKEGVYNYLLSHNATIWRKDYILKHQRVGEDPWTNEIEGSKRMSTESHSNWMYNIHWHCQPGVAVDGEFSSEHINYTHVVDEMMYTYLKYKIKN